jgi:spore coat protein U-like protein
MLRHRTLTSARMILATALFSIAVPDMARAVCQINLSTLNFGNYDPLETSAVDSVGNLMYFCSQPVPFVTITIDRSGTGTVLNRRMNNNSSGQDTDALLYNIYLDAARTAIWGDGTQGSQIWSAPNPAVRTRINVPIYGRIPAGQNVGVGGYGDTLTITINY